MVWHQNICKDYNISLICSMVVVTLNSHRGSPGSIPRRSWIYSPLLSRNWHVKMMGRGVTRSRASGVSWFLQNEGNWGRLLTVKTRSMREHLTSQLSWEAAWLLVTCGSPVYLVIDQLRPCFKVPYDWARWFCWRFFDMVNLVVLIGSWCYSREWVWNLRTKLCCIISGKWNLSRVSLQGFDITYIMV